MTGAQASASRRQLLPAGRSEISMASIPQTYRAIAKTARRAGWAVFFDGAGHVAFYGPNGEKCRVASTTARSGATPKNYLGVLRRAGVPGAERK